MLQREQLLLDLKQGRYPQQIEVWRDLTNTAGSDAPEICEAFVNFRLARFKTPDYWYLWVANFEGQSFGLYENLGNCIFQHASDARGISAVGGVYVGCGTAFFDFDCDGDEDLFTANGHVTPSALNSPFQQEPLLFENNSGKRFS